MGKARRREPTLFDSGSSDLARWRDGVALPLIPALAGLYALATGHLVLPTKGRWTVIEGTPARAAGVAALALAACLHFYSFWSTDDRLSAYSAFATGISAAAFLGALGLAAYSWLF